MGTTLAGAGLIAISDVQPSDDPANRAETFLPPDGAAAELVYDSGERWILESGYGTGVGVLLQQPPIAGEHQLSRLEATGALASARFWRQTWTDEAGESGQITALYELTTDGIRLITLTGGPNGFSFDPGLLVLPSNVSPGSTWSSEGAALPQGFLDFRSTGSARAADDGCLDAEVAVSYATPDDPATVLLETTETSTWCPGRGIVATTFVNGDVPGGTTTEGLDARRPLDASDEPLAVTLPADGWRSGDVVLLTRDPLFGETPITGATDGTIAVASSGVAAILTGDDVVGYRVDAEPPADSPDAIAAERVWVAHPGGRVTELSAIGDAVLVATTERELHAYDGRGRRAWTADFADVIMEPATADGNGGAITVTLDGEVRRLSLEDGTTRWSATVSDTPVAAAAVDDDTAYVVTGDDTLHALALDDGSERWTATAEKAQSVAVIGDRVIVGSGDASLLAFDVGTGEPLWVSDLPSIARQLRIAGDVIVAVTIEGTAGYDERGTLLWTRPESLGVVTDGERVALLGPSGVTVVDASGSETGRWEPTPARAGVSRTLVAIPGGLWLFGSDFTAVEGRADD